MRVLRDHQHTSYAPTAQHSSVTTVARVQQLWNEWEIQCLVLVSFSLQVFLLFSAGFRKRYRIRALSVLLWLAYLSADSVAVFVLGRLTLLLGDDPHHQLVLFWAPFLLLHLGGQDTITAFSMEDCALWKRHVLNLTTQVAMAIYVVGKQWRWDKQLVAPMVLMFISGTTKYAERAWALRRAGSWEPRRKTYYYGYLRRRRELASMLSSEESWRIVEVATGIDAFRESIEFLMDVTPKRFGRGSLDTEEMGAAVKRFTSSDHNAADLFYKLSEIRLSLIYDYLYTKFGSLKGVFQYRLTTLVLTSTALAFFVAARARVDHKGSYSGADVCISYILLVGAVALEITSILMWLMSSYWPYMTSSYLQGSRRSSASRCAGRILLSIVKRPRPESRVEWSGKLQQYSLMDECIDQMNQPVSWLEQMLRCVGIKQGYTAKHILIYPEVKKVLLDTLCEIATSPGSQEKLAFNSFRGEWAAAWAASSSESGTGSRSAAQEALAASNIQGMDLVSSALLWHLVTEKCLVMSDDKKDTPNCRFRTCSQHLSNYVMYLVAQCKLMLDSDGHSMLLLYRDALEDARDHRGISVKDKRELVRRFRHGQFGTSIQVGTNILPREIRYRYQEIRALVDRANSVLDKLLGPEFAASDGWEVIAMVWVEMLCYIACNCGSGFHAKQLSAGGEFLTHAKILIFLLYVA